MSETDQITEVEVPNILTARAAADRQTIILQLQEQAKMIEIQTKSQQEMDTSRRNHEIQMETRRTKIDMVKVAMDTLASNAKSKPADERDITASDIKTFADELIQYINEE
jgi:hypothetical protein